MPVQRFVGFPPNLDSTGNIGLRNLLAGQAVGLIHEVKSAKDVVLDLVEGTHQIFERTAAF